MKMINVLILNYEYPPLGGGAANATKYILKEFSKYKNLQIDLVTSSIGKFKLEKISNNITIHYLDIGKDSSKLHSQSNKDLLNYSKKAYFYCKKLKKTKNFDLCHSFFGIPCGFIAKKLKLPYIVSLRGSDVPFYNQKYKFLDKILFKRLSQNIWKNAKYVIANSKGLKNLALKSSLKQEIGVIYNGIDTKEFSAKKNYFNNSYSKNKNLKKVNKLKILCVGRLIPRKGFSYVIDAIKPINDKISLSFIGDGILKKELKLISKGYNIKFLGILEHDKLAKLYKKYDIFCLPSFNEGMSNTVLEAMASGLALIVTDTGGTCELIKGNGFVVKSGNAYEIEKCLRKYLKNSNMIKEQGEKSRRIAKNMSWENVAKNYFILYEKICVDS